MPVWEQEGKCGFAPLLRNGTRLYAEVVPKHVKIKHNHYAPTLAVVRVL